MRLCGLTIACLLLTATLVRGQQSAYQLPATPVEALPLGTWQPPAKPQELSPFPFRQVSAEEPIAAATTAPPLKLAPRNAPLKPIERATPNGAGQAIGSIVGSLAVVLGLFLVVVWCSRRFAPAGSSLLPKEVVELLGRAPLTGRQSMQLVRIGNKLLLVAISTAGAETLTEITDPVEVEHLSALCRRGRIDSATSSFTQVLGQLASDPAPGSIRSRLRGSP